MEGRFCYRRCVGVCLPWHEGKVPFAGFLFSLLSLFLPVPILIYLYPYPYRNHFSVVSIVSPGPGDLRVPAPYIPTHTRTHARRHTYAHTVQTKRPSLTLNPPPFFFPVDFSDTRFFGGRRFDFSLLLIASEERIGGPSERGDKNNNKYCSAELPRPEATDAKGYHVPEHHVF